MSLPLLRLQPSKIFEDFTFFPIPYSALFVRCCSFWTPIGHNTHRRGQARLLTEDFDGAIEDFNTALSLNPENEFLTSMIYVHRGYALLLQGKEKSAQTDFQKSEVGPGQRIIIELHLRTLENQIKMIRHRRLAKQRNIS